METTANENETEAPLPTPAIEPPMSYAQLYTTLRDELALRSFCLDVETWHHAYVDGATVNTTWKVYVCWKAERTRHYEAPTSSSLLALVRAELAAEPVEVVAVPEQVLTVGDVPATSAAPPLAPITDDHDICF